MNTTIFNDNSELHIITEKIFNFTQEIFVLNFNITKYFIFKFIDFQVRK